MDAEGGGESGHPDEGVEVDADGEPGVICPEALLDHQFLGVAGPSLDERLREQAAPHVSLDELAEHPAVGEVAGRDLVHRDGGTHGGAEDGQPLVLGLLVPGLVGQADVVASRNAAHRRDGGAGPTSHAPPGGGRRSLPVTKAVASSIVWRAAA